MAHGKGIPTLRRLRAADSPIRKPFPQLKSLEDASRIKLGFPQHLYGKEMVRACRYGGVWDRLLL